MCIWNILPQLLSYYLLEICMECVYEATKTKISWIMHAKQQIQIVSAQAFTQNSGLSCRPLNHDHLGQFWCGAEICKQPLGNWKTRRHMEYRYLECDRVKHMKASLGDAIKTSIKFSPEPISRKCGPSVIPTFKMFRSFLIVCYHYKSVRTLTVVFHLSPFLWKPVTSGCLQ